ncbi:MAG: sulfite exporter TauE/SafE family protein [Chlamydiota bacterium]
MFFYIKALVALISFSVFIVIYLEFRKLRQPLLSGAKNIKLIIAGLAANIADTIGLGNFAVFVAFNKHWKIIDDKELPGTLNGHTILPAMMQSILFLKLVEIDPLMLMSLVSTACLGGWAGGFLVSRLNKQTMRKVMTFGFIGIGLLIVGRQLNLFPIGGEAIALDSYKLAIGLVGMFFVGMLPSIGVGLYAPIQVLLFFLGLSPLVAFPIMTTTGALVQSMTALAFVTKKGIDLRATILLSFAGMLGVLIAVPFVTLVNMNTLRWLLVGIVFYNAIMMWNTYRQEKRIAVPA